MGILGHLRVDAEFLRDASVWQEVVEGTVGDHGGRLEAAQRSSGWQLIERKTGKSPLGDSSWPGVKRWFPGKVRRLRLPGRSPPPLLPTKLLGFLKGHCVHSGTHSPPPPPAPGCALSGGIASGAPSVWGSLLALSMAHPPILSLYGTSSNPPILPSSNLSMAHPPIIV